MSRSLRLPHATLMVALSFPLAVRGQAAATGADSLGIRDLLDISTAAISDLSADGKWLAVILSSRRDGLGVDFSRDGDPTYLRVPLAQLIVVDTRAGTRRAVWPVKKAVRSVSWKPDGTRLAMLVLDEGALHVTVWDRTTGAFISAKLPPGQYVAENSDLRWTGEGDQVAFAARSDVWRAGAKARFAELTNGPVVALDGGGDFLEWDGVSRMSNMRSIVSWDPVTGALKTLYATTLIGQWTLARNATAITVQEDISLKTNYDVIGGREWRLVTRSSPAAGASRVLAGSLKGVTISWADDGQRYSYAKDGKVWIGSIADSGRRQILGPTGETRAGESADTSADAKRQRERDHFAVTRWSPSGDAIMATNHDGFWLVDVASGAKEMIVVLPDTTTRAARPQLIAWSHDGRYLYFNVNSRSRWERVIARYDRQSKQLKDLVKDARLYSGLHLSNDGTTAALDIGDGNHVPDVYIADASLAGLKRVVEANPQLAQKSIAKTELISYLDADGKTRYGVLTYPLNYKKGTRYPTVFIIYEDFFDDSWDSMANLLSAHGYAVVKPSVGFEIGYPGEAWLKSVTSAANAVITMGVADSSRLGVQGTSYGGYATNLLITQTGRFAAAINMSGKVDLISFYTDSPRLGVRNIHAAEKSQDRIGATLWQQPQKYIAHSAIMYADRITTPLLLLTGGQDHNVPELNEREMYYALRRLGKTVNWVSYTNGGHGVPSTTESDFVDYHQRVLDWYAKYLGEKRPPAASNGGMH